MTAFIIAFFQKSSTWGPDEAPKGVHLELETKLNPRTGENYVVTFVNESEVYPIFVHSIGTWGNYRIELLDSAKKEPPLTSFGAGLGAPHSEGQNHDFASEIYAGNSLSKSIYFDLEKIYQLKPHTNYFMRVFYFDGGNGPLRLTSNQIKIKT